MSETGSKSLFGRVCSGHLSFSLLYRWCPIWSNKIKLIQIKSNVHYTQAQRQWIFAGMQQSPFPKGRIAFLCWFILYLKQNEQNHCCCHLSCPSKKPWPFPGLADYAYKPIYIENLGQVCCSAYNIPENERSFHINSGNAKYFDQTKDILIKPNKLHNWISQK